MIYLFVGHRGVGKTTFIRQLSEFYSENSKKLFIDLDKEIEKQTGLKVSQIFDDYSEDYFREQERKALFTVIKEKYVEDKELYIALGAGYNRELPENTEVIFIRRDSDSAGRIFTDRPRLDGSVSSLQEYFERFDEREQRYMRLANKVITLPEGLQDDSGKKSSESNISELIHFYFEKNNSLGPSFSITLLPSHFKNFTYWYNDKEHWPIQFFEIRDDLLSDNQIEEALSVLPKNKILFSYRNLSYKGELSDEVKKDWDIDLGEPPNNVDIVSLHNISESIELSLEKINKYKNHYHLKLSPEVNSFEELQVYHNWWLENKGKRSLLPRSLSGRWEWYRLLHSEMKLNFAKINNGSAVDQPYVSDFVMRPKNTKSFAAVLGSNIKHSYTPSEQRQFFYKKDWPVLKISSVDIKDLKFLRELGLKAAAVTSPYKKVFLEALGYRSDNVKKFVSVNTMYFSKKIYGENTDIDGLEKLISDIDVKDRQLVVWGGGGTLAPLKSVLPSSASYYSARESQPRPGSKKKSSCDILIWAAGNYNSEIPKKWKPKYVVDLDYKENSIAREVAAANNALYISGEKMFREQAKGQRLFWSKCFERFEMPETLPETLTAEK